MDLKQPIAKWRKDPTLFVKTVLNAKPDKWQSGVMQAVANGDRGVSIRSGHDICTASRRTVARGEGVDEAIARRVQGDVHRSC